MTQSRLPERVLLGPGPSVIASRVMQAMAAPVLSHLDPDFVPVLDDIAARLARVFRAGPGALALAVSGTGTAAMEAAVSNLVADGARVTAVVTGYFGERLVEMCRRYGAQVARVDVEWGRACDPAALRRSLRDHGADVGGDMPRDGPVQVGLNDGVGVAGNLHRAASDGDGSDAASSRGGVRHLSASAFPRIL